MLTFKKFKPAHILLFLALVLSALFLSRFERSSLMAAGAKLYFSPESGSFSAGKTFTVNVLLDSGGGVGVNAADGTVAFDPAYLSAVSATKDGSVFSLWTSEPSFSNTKGTVSFSGGNPSAYSGSGGTVVKITFKVVKAGNAALSMTGASILAADGKGTNVLSESGKASFALGEAASSPSPVPAPAAGSPEPAPAASIGFKVNIEIISPTHPDSAKWYAAKTATFKWKLSPDLDGVSARMSKSASAVPPRTSEGTIESKEFNDLDDGAWHLSIRFKDQSGSWSETIRRQVLVDSVPPANLKAEVMATDKNVPPKVSLKADDVTSGIDRFELVIDDKLSLTVAPDQLIDGVYTMQAVLPGSHKLEVKAFDRAGNVATTVEALQIAGLGAPEVRSAPGIIEEDKPIIVEGVADGNSTVTVRLERDGKVITEETVKATEDGSWTYIYRKHLSPGDYSIATKMMTKAGAESTLTDKIGVTVVSAPFMAKYGFVLVMFLIFVIAGLVLFGFYERRAVAKKKAVIKREADEMRDKTEAIFGALHDEIEEKLKLLDPIQAEKMGSKQLDGGDVLDKFKEALDISHDTLTKEMEDIEKALE
ncbi:MAG: hypothetical protein A2945_01595 [Candidatus Liptonbacteria bacterium RIFCSPLOWO2_01_FULL_52_25]|uniref:Cohesin domain-containing protein n=1 Tax=Candidatus Liptonbacteria bacterium RIFCSPLOWO2_01_FULL_52_25 TaxID=1798650 RepID=A0A1G2CDS0_9BACT|nr:MAG: hypothetical protein A2945_01595 [Candidatus Liptonbacteria bacterium RIFCSPLOWO2_01_FULL_52_25]